MEILCSWNSIDFLGAKRGTAERGHGKIKCGHRRGSAKAEHGHQ